MAKTVTAVEQAETTLKILRTGGELSVRDRYFLTMSPSVSKMKDLIGQEFEFSIWAKYEDVNSKGELQTILSFATPEGDVMATNSNTFITDFEKMWDLFTSAGETINAIKVVSGKSKADREFITCVYAR